MKTISFTLMINTCSNKKSCHLFKEALPLSDTEIVFQHHLKSEVQLRRVLLCHSNIHKGV